MLQYEQTYYYKTQHNSNIMINDLGVIAHTKCTLIL